MWSERYYVIAAGYDIYGIIEVWHFKSNNRKYVPCERFKLVTKWTTLCVSHISEKWLSV